MTAIGSAAEVERTADGEAPRRCMAALAASLAGAERREQPFRHWLMREVLPREVAAELDRLPFVAPDLGGISGSREAHNATRTYFDAAAVARHRACRAVAECFQSEEAVASLAAASGADLDGCHLRIEFAQDTGGFWLRPHTDLGVKRFTLLYYLSPEGRPDLGTDLYADAETWATRAAFEPGAALAFVPSDRTWHGFEPRPIGGVRKSVIVNYVTDEWRAREQLSFPDRPVRTGARR